MRTGKEYRLFCGRGIKNIHIWSFKPEGAGEWTCLYDTNTNGSTVELVAFRNGGLEGISKVCTRGRGSAGSMRHRLGIYPRGVLRVKSVHGISGLEANVGFE